MGDFSWVGLRIGVEESLVRKPHLTRGARLGYVPLSHSTLCWKLFFVAAYPVLFVTARAERRERSIVTHEVAQGFDKSFGELPVDMELRSDGYGFGVAPTGFFGSATVLWGSAWLAMLALGPLDDGGSVDSAFRLVLGVLIVPTMYSGCLMALITGYRGALCRRDHARWVKAGRPEDWVPSPRSQPRDLDFLYALVPVAIAFMYICARDLA